MGTQTVQRDIAPGVVTVPASSALGGFRWGLQQFPPWLSGWLYSGLGPDLILGCRRTVLAGGVLRRRASACRTGSLAGRASTDGFLADSGGIKVLLLPLFLSEACTPELRLGKVTKFYMGQEANVGRSDLKVDVLGRATSRPGPQNQLLPLGYISPCVLTSV